MMITTPLRRHVGAKQYDDQVYCVKYGLDYEFARKHKQEPYFSITYSGYRAERVPGEETVLLDGKRYWSSSFGCGGADTQALLSALFPETAPLWKWHMTGLPGVPMHYIANGLHWWSQGTCHRKFELRDHEPDPWECFAGTVVLGGAPKADAGLTPRGFYLWKHEQVWRWLEARLPELSAEFMAAMTAIGVLEDAR